MIDMNSILLDPSYGLWGTPAVITTKSSQVIPCLILDHRDGFQLMNAKGQTTMIPGLALEDAGVLVRHSQCPEKPSGGTIVINGEVDAYRIKGTEQVGVKGNGEWALVLEIIR